MQTQEKMSLQKQAKKRAIDGTMHISAKPSKAVQTPLKPISAHPTLFFTISPAFPFSFSFSFFLCTRDSAIVVLLSNWSI